MSANPKTIKEPAAVVPLQGTNPMHMLSVAIERGMDASVLKDLMDLEQRWRAQQAKQAFDEAFAAFKAEAIEIIRNKLVTDGPLKGKAYAELFAVVNAATPALSRHGFATSWKVTKDEPQWIEVTCILAHKMGHSETASFGGPPDAGGAKNAIQARASTVTYLERYTFKAVTGLAEQNADTDGNTPGKVMPAEEIDKWVKKIEATTTKEKAKAACLEAITAAEGYNDLSAYQTFKDAHKAHSEFIDTAK